MPTTSESEASEEECTPLEEDDEKFRNKLNEKKIDELSKDLKTANL